MAVSCRVAEERLLMLIHGQMPFALRIALLSHLAVCPACRQRRAALEKATAKLAREIRGSAMPAWRPHARPLPSRELLAGSAAIIAVVAMMGSIWGSNNAEEAQRLKRQMSIDKWPMPMNKKIGGPIPVPGVVHECKPIPIDE